MTGLDLLLLIKAGQSGGRAQATVAGLQNLIRLNFNQLDQKMDSMKQKIDEVEAQVASRLDRLEDALLNSAQTGADLHKRQAAKIDAVQGAVGPVIEALRDQLEDARKLGDGTSGMKLNPQVAVAVSVRVTEMISSAVSLNVLRRSVGRRCISCIMLPSDPCNRTLLRICGLPFRTHPLTRLLLVASGSTML